MLYFAADPETIPYGGIKGTCRRGDMLETPFKWLSQYCNFFPPLFVSSDPSKLTGYSHNSNKVLFGYKFINNGYPVKYDEWIKVCGVLSNIDTNDFLLMDKSLVDGLRDLKYIEDNTYENADLNNINDLLRKKLFVKEDQYAVSYLDLRKSSVIICSSEIQKATLVRKGFPNYQVKVSTYLPTYSE